ncbi:MAG TPA: tetratricopeptide repeat protein [Gemmatimonadaceae bacterium]|nr:tetratricopeptide repeat protein [Gemmatimonadaceae bacterium]
MDTPGRIAELERKFAGNPRRYFAALANEFRKQGELEHAIELCEAHLSEQRNHLSGHVVLAQALVDAGRESDAWDPLHTALDLDPENFIALRLIGELFARVGDVDQARSYFFRALEIEPRNEQLLAAVKNLSQRPPSAAEPAATARPEQTAVSGLREDVSPLSGLESTAAFSAEAAAEPFAEEPAPDVMAPAPTPGVWRFDETDDAHDAGSEPAADQQPLEELPLLEPLEPSWGEPPARSAPGEASERASEEPLESAGSQLGSEFTDWAPDPDTVVEPAPGDDWVSAAGSVPTEGAGDRDTAAAKEEPPREQPRRYDYHDWLPPLVKDSRRADADRESTVTDQADAAADTPPTQSEDAAERVELEVVEFEAVESEAAEFEAVEPEVVESEVVESAPVESEPVEFEPAEPEPPVPAELAEPEQDEGRPVLASETMVDLYLQQGHVSLAIDVLRELVTARPDDERLRARLAGLEQQQAGGPPRQTVRDMFARFARTSQPLREHGQPQPVGHAPSRGQPAPGPLDDFFAQGPPPASGERPDALLAMLSPPEPAAADEAALSRWLGALRSS